MALNQEMMRRRGELPPSEQDLLDIFQTTPRRIIEEKDLFVRFCEAFIYISHRTGEGAGAKAPIKFNNTQHCVINSYFDQKAMGVPVRTLGLKGRQQGFSTVVEVIAFMDTLCKGGQNVLIATEHKEKSGYNIYEMFHLMLTRFPIALPTAHVQDGQRIQFDDTMGRGMLNVSGEITSTSYTYRFIHLSEAAFFQSLNTFLNMLLQTVLNTDKSTCVFLETTANRFGDEFHDRWVRAEEGKSSYQALFIPWFVHEEYKMSFLDEVERTEFDTSLGQPENMDRYGDEIKLLSTPVYPVKIDDETTIECKITLEQLKWRRDMIDNSCGGSILEFHRQYPTTSEEAFISAGINVLDTSSLAWYRQYIQNGIRAGAGFSDHDILQFHDQDQSAIIIPIVREAIPDYRQSDKFRLEDTMQGVITVYEPYHPYKEYIMGSDHAEGLESGDFSCAYIVSRNPRRIVAKIRGYDGRRLDPEEFASQMFAMYRMYDPWVCPENNKDGGTVIALMRQWGCNKFISESIITKKSTGGSQSRFGWMNNQATKKQGVALLQKAIREKEWKIPDMMLIEECQTLIYKNGKVQAARKGERRPPGSSALGYYDDAVFAFVGCLLADQALPPARTQEGVREDEDRMNAFYEEPALKPGETPHSKGWA